MKRPQLRGAWLPAMLVAVVASCAAPHVTQEVQLSENVGSEAQFAVRPLRLFRATVREPAQFELNVETAWERQRKIWGKAYQRGVEERAAKLGMGERVRAVEVGEYVTDALIVRVETDEVQRNWSWWKGGADVLPATVVVKDIESDKERFRADVNASSVGTGPKGWSEAGRVEIAAENLGRAVAEHLAKLGSTP